MATISSPPSSSAAIRRWHRPHSSRCRRIFPCSSPSSILSISSRLHSSRAASSSSDAGGSVEGAGDELHHALPVIATTRRAVPVFVTLPVDAVGPAGQVSRRKTMDASFVALSAAGIEGVAVEVWWGVAERERPGVYEWGAYLDLVRLAGWYGLKVRAIMAFHQRGAGAHDPCWLPLPLWVLKEMDINPDLEYSDRFGRRNKEYISLGCDILPVLHGRSPIQAYSDFMRSFRDTFREYLGVIITEIQVGMGPSGELRYPSCSEKPTRLGSLPELGEFHCYDKYMLASLNACAQNISMREWGGGGPLGAWSLLQNPEGTNFFKNDGFWNEEYGRFFLTWYSDMLIFHGEKLSMTADEIFLGTGVKLLAKIAGIYWHYRINSHPSELTAGYYNTLTRDGYLRIARMFARHRMTLCCAHFDLRYAEEEAFYPASSPEGFLRQLLHAARICKLPIAGENSRFRMDDASLKQIVKNSTVCYDGSPGSSLSFNFVRMNKNLFEAHNWRRFTQFVRQMSDVRTFQAKLGLAGTEFSCISLASAAEEVRRVLGVHF